MVKTVKVWGKFNEAPVEFPNVTDLHYDAIFVKVVQLDKRVIFIPTDEIGKIVSDDA